MLSPSALLGATTAEKKLIQTAVHIDVGSGGIVQGPSGAHYLLTNSHVCMVTRYKGMVRATFPDGTLVEGKIVKDSLAMDLCAAKIIKRANSLKIAKKLQLNQVVCTRGYPRGIVTNSCGRVGGMTLWGAVFPLELIGKCPAGTQEYINPYSDTLLGCSQMFISTLVSVYSRPGSSGSPVVNTRGELVGVVSSWHPDNEYDSGMVPLSQIQEFFKGL